MNQNSQEQGRLEEINCVNSGSISAEVKVRYNNSLIIKENEVGTNPLYVVQMWEPSRAKWSTCLTKRSRVGFPVLPKYEKLIRSGMGSTQHREDNWVST